MISTTLNTITTTTAPINFSFYMIDQTHANMVEIDATSPRRWSSARFTALLPTPQL